MPVPTYRVWVLIHLLGVLLFFANLVVAFGLMVGTRRAIDPGILGYSYGLLHAIDRWLTPISVLLIFGAGVVAASVAGIRLLQPWVTRPLLAMGLSGLFFAMVVLPAQRALVRRGAEMATGEAGAYRGLRRRWWIGAMTSTAAALFAMAHMVLTSPR
jgi:uncharacterized membrane protein